MKVTIITPYARLSVELAEAKAASLLTEVLMAAIPEPEPVLVETTHVTLYKDLFANLPEEMPEADPTPEEPEEEADEEIVVEETIDPEPPAGFVAQEPTPEKGYRGFLHMKCNRCHKEKSFHVKWPLKEYRCECGHTMPMKDLSKVELTCDCGWKFNYYTNQDADAFEMKCISCEKPVLVKWNFRHKRYEKSC